MPNLAKLLFDCLIKFGNIVSESANADAACEIQICHSLIVRQFESVAGHDFKRKSVIRWKHMLHHRLLPPLRSLFRDYPSHP